MKGGLNHVILNPPPDGPELSRLNHNWSTTGPIVSPTNKEKGRPGKDSPLD
jgi:hypothetical protein